MARGTVLFPTPLLMIFLVLQKRKRPTKPLLGYQNLVTTAGTWETLATSGAGVVCHMLNYFYHFVLKYMNL